MIRIDSLGRAGLASRFLEARRILPACRSDSPDDFGPDVVGGVQVEPFRSDR